MDFSRQIEISILLMILVVGIGLFVFISKPNFTGFSVAGSNLFSPGDFVNDGNIEASKDKITINLKGLVLSRYYNSDSMLPVFGVDSTGIEITPKDEEQIKVGDIITFEKEGRLIAHRVIDKGADEKGVFFITKGDNNNLDDGKIRFAQIKGILVGILY
mgnify:CR=1 FL=1